MLGNLLVLTVIIGESLDSSPSLLTRDMPEPSTAVSSNPGAVRRILGGKGHCHGQVRLGGVLTHGARAREWSLWSENIGIFGSENYPRYSIVTHTKCPTESHICPNH